VEIDQDAMGVRDWVVGDTDGPPLLTHPKQCVLRQVLSIGLVGGQNEGKPQQGGCLGFGEVGEVLRVCHLNNSFMTT